MRRRGSGPAWPVTLSLWLVLVLAVPGPARAQEPDTTRTNDLSEMSLEQLGNIHVTSVSRRAEKLSEAAASVYVITAEDIRRSGARTLPEALRLAPSLEVARADASQYAISARGMLSVLANKMLVLIDGRTVYSPLFSGVFWEAQDIVLEDVDRIEVISGPGGASWGTNAVNGVINIISRTSAETRGVMVSGGAGDQARGGGARVGWGSGPYFRVSGKYVEHDPSRLADGTAAQDDWRRWLVGGRGRWVEETRTVYVDAGGYRNRIDQLPSERDVSGYHVLGALSHHPPRGPSSRVQAYYERSRRDQPGAVKDVLDTWDLDYQSTVAVSRHEVTWGAGYRDQNDQVDNLSPAFAFVPGDRRLRYANAFVEDQWAIADRVELTGGLRLEHNVYTDWEYLPTVRLSWRPAGAHFLWLAASRAVRAPSRIDREFTSSVFVGGPNFRSEILHALEVGYRAQPMAAVSYSVSAYANFYDRLRSIEPAPGGLALENGLKGDVHGAEVWINSRVTSWFRLSAGGAAQRTEIERKPGSNDMGGQNSLGIDPDHWWSLRAAVDAGHQIELDAIVRQVGALRISGVPRYTTLNARAGWRPISALELSVTGTDLLGPRHAEWGSAPNRVTLGRQAFAQFLWRY
ncbi:MAG TPA: TonB-dependent receptor [Candidatus Eisenbacteria bacterium]|nr:TonB-dependent receptor [Candidatus Eisenbacteria bacterium]